MGGSLAPVRERLAWARERFQQLETACDEFVYEDPNGSAAGFIVEIDTEAGSWMLRYQMPGQLPSRLAWLVGEILYHLRGSLDNLAWQLVLANDGTPGTHTEFPVFKDEEEFQRRARRKMRGMSKTATTAIESLQPFKTWPEHPDHTTLWKIHDLNAIDKHRLPHLACLWLAWVKGNAVVGAGGKVEFTRERGCLEDGAKVLHLSWDPALTDQDTEMQVNFEVSLDIAIHNPGQVEFMAGWNEPEVSVPVRHLFKVAFDYLETTVLPSFSVEFA